MKTAIPSINYANVKKRLDKLVRKANRYGNTEIAYTFGERYFETVKIDGEKVDIEYIEIEVTGEAPVYQDGWKLLARIELMVGDENLVHIVPDSFAELDRRFRTHGNTCEHCNKARRRNDVYVFEKDGEQIAVGKSCLRDFIGCDNPEEIVKRAEFFQSLDRLNEDELDDIRDSLSAGQRFTLKTVLNYSAARIRKDGGYVSKAAAEREGGISTSSRVQYALTGVQGFELDVSDEDKNLATEVIEYFRATDYFANDYLDNLRVLFKSDIVDVRHQGLVISAVSSYLRQKGTEAAIKKAADSSEFVGSVKERLRGLELTLEKVIYLGCNNYGESYLHSFKDEAGNVFVWITGGIDAQEGDTLTLDGTVKDHKEYRGINQTVLTRCRVK